MPKQHTVKQGEHISRIAEQYGFRTHQVIWDHPANAELKKKRQNPNVLYPGDQIQIPDKEAKRESKPTGQRHRFQLKGEEITLRLVVEDIHGKPIANADCELRVEGKVYQLKSDANGRIEQQVPASSEKGELAVKNAETPWKEQTINLQIGHLDPVEELSGQVGRLNNLGYYAGGVDPLDELLLQSAVEEFQCDYGLAVDGECGPDTQKKLLEVHGC
jgi:N-acetylmuramoyl-L-alanine amidase